MQQIIVRLWLLRIVLFLIVFILTLQVFILIFVKRTVKVNIHWNVKRRIHVLGWKIGP